MKLKKACLAIATTTLLTTGLNSALAFGNNDGTSPLTTGFDITLNIGSLMEISDITPISNDSMSLTDLAIGNATARTLGTTSVCMYSNLGEALEISVSSINGDDSNIGPEFALYNTSSTQSIIYTLDLAPVSGSNFTIDQPTGISQSSLHTITVENNLLGAQPCSAGGSNNIDITAIVNPTPYNIAAGIYSDTVKLTLQKVGS